MAKKVFRIHSQGALISDWFSSTNINSALIGSIQTNSGDGKRLPTSIPSPFARIDLVRNAYAIVAASGNLDGLVRNGISTATDNHKLVSDALDIGQIFFNYNKYSKDLSLLSWNRSSSLEILLRGNAKQKHLGNTLKLYLIQDSEQYNFNEFDEIFILYYRHQIIGATSPRTLFFAAPNAQPTKIHFGLDIMLDHHLLPLYKREPEFIKYLVSVSRTTPHFNSLFPEFNKYLQQTIAKLSSFDSDLYQEINTLDYTSYINSLQDVVLNDNTGHPVNITRDLTVKQYVKDPALIESKSDFTIRSSKAIEGFKPLVLPVDTFNYDFTYTTDQWDPEIEIPHEDPRRISDRTLPGQEDLYPFLTVNDFLADRIIKLPHNIDRTKFFTLTADPSYLLPIKPIIFDYFNIDEIKAHGFIESRRLAGDAIEVSLNIPIKQGQINFSKTYYSTHELVNQARNPKKGRIISNDFALSVYPLVKGNEVEIDYNIGVAYDPDSINYSKIDVYNSETGNQISAKRKHVRSDDDIKTLQSVFNSSFDAILIQLEDVSNILIPKFKKYSGSTGDSYSFSIDFGTTNTHIEYKIEGQGNERSFDISKEDQQIAFLLSSNTERDSDIVRSIFEMQSYLKQESEYEFFGNESLIQTPFRTCLLQNVEIDYDTPTSYFTDVNVGFDYEKELIRPYLDELTNLKWAQHEKYNETQVRHFIEGALIVCKNKVLLNNGNLSQTKVNWFFPVSMTTSHLSLFRAVWSESFEKIIGGAPENINGYPESIGPFYYYKSKGGIQTITRPSVSIDIGGGTSDVMIFAGGEPQLISSFKFAGNSIFGEGFNNSIANNGFVNRFKDSIETKLKRNGLNEEKDILEQIFGKMSTSNDLINFFFSLKSNKRLREKQLDLDFENILRKDDDFKIIFLLFHSAIIYHIAEMMKIKGYDMPRNIVYSGSGSKTLRIIENTSEMSSIRRLFQEIFKEVYNVEEVDIGIINSSNPKEVTAKGGFYINGNLTGVDHNEYVYLNLGNFYNKVVQKKASRNVETITYGDLDDAFFEGVIMNINTFFKLFSNINVLLNFQNLFGVSHRSLQIFDTVRKMDLMDYLLQGYEELKVEVNKEETVGETLFFLPLIGLMNRLATEIGEN